MTLIEVTAKGTMGAMVLHANGVPVTEAQCERARGLIKAEWDELLRNLRDAKESHLGNDMLKYILNLQCNHWAVRALKEV